MCNNVRIQLQLGLKTNFVYAFSRKYENSRESVFKKIYENGGNLNFGNGVSLIMFTKVGILICGENNRFCIFGKISAIFVNFRENVKTKMFVSTLEQSHHGVLT
jgi:hypothetical protein